jgi:hypothetical protein
VKFVKASISLGLLAGRINFDLVNAPAGEAAIQTLVPVPPIGDTIPGYEYVQCHQHAHQRSCRIGASACD